MGPSQRSPTGPRAANSRLDSLAVRGLTYTYPGSGRGVEGVDLDLARGSFTVITGRVGSGKTTLLRALLGLLPAQSGRGLLERRAGRGRGDLVPAPALRLHRPVARPVQRVACGQPADGPARGGGGPGGRDLCRRVRAGRGGIGARPGDGGRAKGRPAVGRAGAARGRGAHVRARSRAARL